MECSFEGCSGVIKTKRSGLCEAHYTQQRRGKPLTPVRSRTPNYKGPTPVGHRWCPKCSSMKTESEFYPINKKDPSKLMGYCKKCSDDRVRSVYQENYMKVTKIKMSSGCADCGYNLYPRALEFDHLPGFEKHSEVSAMLTCN